LRPARLELAARFGAEFGRRLGGSGDGRLRIRTARGSGRRRLRIHVGGDSGGGIGFARRSTGFAVGIAICRHAS
jgi:hypothetical protein